MASEGAVAKRAKLVASRVHWGHTDLCESSIHQDQEIQGNSSQNSVGKWLSTTITEEDAKQEPLQEAAGPLRRNPSSDDDLDLGVEASIYGKEGVRTVQEFLRWSSSSPALSRWNSFSSATSGHSGPLSVMDILNLWNDDPEEILLDLGFGCDEPDLSGRIPARFISYQSQARGINLQVFLEAQKNRLDLENPDVSNRFRQLEVLQQVTTAFSSLVASSSSPMQAAQGKDLPPEAQERRRRMGILFRRASKKSLGQIHNYKTQDLTIPAANSAHCPAPESQERPPSLRDKKVSLKRIKPGSLETVCLSPLAEEQGNGPDLQSQPHLDLTAQEGAFKLREGYPHSANAFLQRKKSQGQTRESFEMEEIHSFDESSVTGSYVGGAENLVRSLIRTNSCQSDSSGFLEEPFIPLVPHLASPGLDIIKAHSGLSERNSDSQGNKKPGSSPSSPHTDKFPVFASTMISSVADKYLPSSPCLSPDPSIVLSSPITPASFSNCDLQIANTEKAPNQDQSPPTCLPALECENLSPCSSSFKLQKITQCQSLSLPFHTPGTSFSPTSSQVQPASSIRGSEEIQSVDRSAPSTSPSTLSHDSQGKTSALASCLSPNVDSQVYESIAMSSTQPDSSRSSCTQSEGTKLSLYESPISSSGCISSVLPSSSDLPHSAISERFSPPTLVSPKLIKFTEYTPENNNNLFFSPDSDGQSFSISTTGRQNEDNGSVSVFSFHLDEANPSQPVSSLSCKLYIPDCQPDMSSQSNYPNDLIDPAAGGISDLPEQLATKQNSTVLPQKNRQYSYSDNTGPALVCQIQNITNVKMDDISLKKFQIDEKQQGENERHSSIVQAQEDVASSKYTETPAALSESFTSVSEEVNSQTEMDKLVTSYSLHDEISAKAKEKGTIKICQKQVICTESESPGSYISLRDQVAEPHNKAERNPKNLIEIESLDLAFETSVDGSDSENVDIDAFFQQLDTEGRVYWAEPIQLSNPTPEASGSFETSDGSPGDSFSSTSRVMPLPMSSSANTDRGQTSRDPTASLDVSSSLTLATSTSQSAIPNIKPSNRSVSVQMSSYLSSHIVHRKDVPYVTESKHTRLPTVLPLDTSTPFRAVQSWTDLQIQRNALIKNLSYGSLHAIPNKANVSMSCPGITHKPTHPEIFSSSPSFFLLSDNWKSQETIPEMAINSETESVSVDTGLWPDEQEERVNRNGNKSERKLWEGSQTATMACCCSCDHHCTCCIQRSYNKESTLGNSLYSLDELEEMMLCLRQFCSVLSNMEEQLAEDQAAVYSCLSDQDREKVRDLEELRRAVKQEAGELEKQLKELAYDYDESLKMKMHRLLDEQSLLCSQLKVFLPGTVSISSSPIPNRTVATQCCLLPLFPPTDMQCSHISDWKSWKNLKPGLGSKRQSSPGSERICEDQGGSPTKADKLDIVGFLQRLKDSLHHSVNTDSLE